MIHPKKTFPLKPEIEREAKKQHFSCLFPASSCCTHISSSTKSPGAFTTLKPDVYYYARPKALSLGFLWHQFWCDVFFAGGRLGWWAKPAKPRYFWVSSLNFLRFWRIFVVFFPVQCDECKRLWIRICRGTLMDEISGIGRRIELLNLNSSRVSPSGWFSLVCRSTTARRVVMKSWTTSSIATWNRYTPQV